MKEVVCLALLLLTVAALVECGPVVVTEKGRLEGKIETSLNGRPFNSFYGIPYARPPIGSYRFKDPEPHGTWQRLARATKMPPPCLQVTFFEALTGHWPAPENVTGEENCLFLNVFAPITKASSKLPVMVWLHGGGFFSGSAEEYLPHTFMDYDVVLVVVQYRLGILGFLSTEDSVMPGNLGLKDQTMALQWIQKNIHQFGGDKKRVTIFGESAGAGSVHFQMLTPKAKGLFSQAIMQSGSALSPWALNTRHREIAEEFGGVVGCEDPSNSTALLHCLQNMDSQELTAALKHTFKWFLLPVVNVPRVDGDYLPDQPARLMVQKRYHKVHLLSGITKDEGALAILPLESELPKLMQGLRDKFEQVGPMSLNLLPDENVDSVFLANKLYKYYLKDFEALDINKLTQLYSAVFFNIDHDEVTKHHATHFPSRRTYRYQLDYRGQHSLCDPFNSEHGNEFVSHADDLIYLFSGGTMLGPLIPEGLKHPEDIHVRDTMLKLWTNFATFGDPTPDDDNDLDFTWEPSTADNLHYLSITPTPSMQPDNRQQEREFLASLPSRNSRILYPDKQQQQEQQQQQQEKQARHHSDEEL